MRKGYVSIEKFVEAWGKSKSIHDMMARTGLSENYIYFRAKKLRAKGINLHRWKDMYVLDVEKMNALLESLLKSNR